MRKPKKAKTTSFKNAVKKIVDSRIETKYNVSTLVDQTVPLNGIVVDVSDTVEGDDIDQRTGREIIAKYFDFRAFLSYKFGAYVALVLDRQPNMGVPATTDIFQGGPNCFAYGTCFKGTAKYPKRFKICWEQRFPDNSTEGSSGTIAIRTAAGADTYVNWGGCNFQKFYKVPDKESRIRYGNVSGVNLTATNAYYIVILSGDGTDDLKGAVTGGQCRMAFKDA